MAGKSTILRCVAAVALLASCGLHAPVAGAARVPRFDQVILRAFAADSPLHGRSSFAVEMDEMRAVLAGATRDSLVLVDELGKGTEACAGSALAGAMLEHLAATRCVGIFATHLHALLDLPLRGDVARLRMLTRHDAASGRRVPAWRVAPGTSTESLALETAAGAGVPAGVVDRAAQLWGMVRGVQVSDGSTGGDEGGDGSGGGGGRAVAVPAPAAAAGLEGEHGGASLAGGVLADIAVAAPARTITLHEAAAILHATAAAMLSGGLGGSRAHAPLPPATIIPPGCDPPAHTASASCVYVLRRADGWFYAGESDALLARLDAHRSRVPVKGGAGLAAAFVALPPGAGNKTVARAIEAATIQKLVDVGVPLLSVTDAVGGRVGRGSGGCGGAGREGQQQERAGVMAA
jgi:hypothetical protein